MGIDNRKMGRMAAWSMAHLSRSVGKVGLVLGSHRYVCQEECEASFRSYLREHAPQLQVLETLVSLEDVELARKATLEMLLCHPDLVGVYVAGGGVEGVLEALREAAVPGLTTVCHDLTDITRRLCWRAWHPWCCPTPGSHGAAGRGAHGALCAGWTRVTGAALTFSHLHDCQRLT